MRDCFPEARGLAVNAALQSISSVVALVQPIPVINVI